MTNDETWFCHSCKRPVGSAQRSNVCRHETRDTRWDHSACRSCSAVKTDSGWGIASNEWFTSLEEARFYRDNGRLPDAVAARTPAECVGQRRDELAAGAFYKTRGDRYNLPSIVGPLEHADDGDAPWQAKIYDQVWKWGYDGLANADGSPHNRDLVERVYRPTQAEYQSQNITRVDVHLGSMLDEWDRLSNDERGQARGLFPSLVGRLEKLGFSEYRVETCSSI
jgi:hypothetical protein